MNAFEKDHINSNATQQIIKWCTLKEICHMNEITHHRARTY